MGSPFLTVLLYLISSAIITINAQINFSEECRSYNRQTGNCVSIQRCPPLLYVLKSKPSPTQLRHLQRLTCGFIKGDPKVCCPTGLISGNSSQNYTYQEEPLPIVKTSLDLTSHPGYSKLPVLSNCGTAIGDYRIIGGTNVSLGAYPWMARIGYRGHKSESVEYYCGGTIIGKRWILTAAHCTEGAEDDVSPVQVRLGEFNIDQEIDCEPELGLCSETEDIKIQKLIPHENYSSNTKQNDISLIQLEKDIQFDKFFIRPICLPFVTEFGLSTMIDGMDKGIVAGWGRTQWNRAHGSKILQQVSVPLKTNKECQSVYNRRVTISSNQLCAGGDAGEDSCGGDSGGPLMIPLSIQRIPRFFQVGVVSYGPVQCGIGGLPGVYARTTAYLKWILDKIIENQ